MAPLMQRPGEPVTCVPDQVSHPMNRQSGNALRYADDRAIVLRRDPPTAIADAADRDLEDLIFSWRRLSDPKLRKIALQVIRSLAS